MRLSLSGRLGEQQDSGPTASGGLLCPDVSQPARAGSPKSNHITVIHRDAAVQGHSSSVEARWAVGSSQEWRMTRVPV